MGGAPIPQKKVTLPMSETATARHILAPYCPDPCLDIGFGGAAITPTAITMDMAQPYCPSLEGHVQILRGDCRRLPFFCDNALASIHSSHLLEDFTYEDLIPILKEWRRVLRPGGLLVTHCPTQQKFLSHIAKTGQGNNLAHKEQDFSLETFKNKALIKSGQWEDVFCEPNHGPYSWLLVSKKV